MFQKTILLLCSLALARAGVIGTHFSPSTSVSSVYSSTNNAPQLHYASPAPVYESVLTTHESKTKGLDGSQQTTYGKAFDTPFSSVKKYDSRITNNGYLQPVYSSPIHSSYLYNPGTYSTVPHGAYVTSPYSNSIITNSVSPITYTTHNTAPLVTNYATPIVTKTVSPATYTTHGGQAVKTTVTYSEAPLVSHMTFTGLGTSYAW